MLGVDIPTRSKDDITVSYTQFSMYQKCPKRWELKYARKLSKRIPNIHLLFGTAVHVTIQEWVTSMFNGDDTYDYVEGFKKNILGEFHEMIRKHGEAFSDVDTLMEFYDDGIEIMHHLDTKLRQYFNPRKYKFVGVEIPIVYSVDENKPRLKLFAHLDLVFIEKSTKCYVIVDIKTSTRGWGFYQQADMSKQSQLVLYKYYFAKMFDIDIERIKTVYFIVKRKVDDDSPWGDDRIQEYIPVQSASMCDTVAAEFNQFIIDAFDSDGVPRLDVEYPAISGEDGSHCRFCEFVDDESLCPKEKRK